MKSISFFFAANFLLINYLVNANNQKLNESDYENNATQLNQLFLNLSHNLFDSLSFIKINSKKILEKQYDFKNIVKLKNNKNISIIKNLTSKTCIDPNEEVLAATLVGFMNQYYPVNGMINVKEVQFVFRSIIDHSILLSSSNHVIYGDKKCLNKKIQTKLNELALCPYHYRIDYRSNRKPNLRANAICNCKNCTRPPVENADIFYRCSPLRVLMPALKREICVNGVYQWKPIYEYVNVACECQPFFERL